MITSINNQIELRDYQLNAIDSLIANDWRGIFEMAIGERVIIVMGAINALKSRISGTLTKYN